MVVPGGRIYTDSRGRSEVPLVLVHGYCGSALDFAEVWRPLSRRRRVIRIEHRGHGRSARAPSYSIEKLVADLAVALERLDAPRVDLLGHSMGGMVVLRHALRRPERVRSLVLMSTSAEPAPLDPVPVMPRGMRQRARARARRMVGRDPAAKLAAEVRGGRAVRRRFLRVARVGHRRVDPRAVEQIGADFGRVTSVLDQLGQLRVPTTVLVGREDRRFLAASRRMHEALPDAELRVLDGAGHFPQFEAKAAWLEAIEGHLDALRGR